mmetsp:Transcript_114253/g.207819  ORF Transcript_114253/g.207819 Transcript_114253/m.207819 type:complete len:133 (+) Transcript_114253:639-1037(+)
MGSPVISTIITVIISEMREQPPRKAAAPMSAPIPGSSQPVVANGTVSDRGPPAYEKKGCHVFDHMLSFGSTFPYQPRENWMLINTIAITRPIRAPMTIIGSSNPEGRAEPAVTAASTKKTGRKSIITQAGMT